MRGVSLGPGQGNSSYREASHDTFVLYDVTMNLLMTTLKPLNTCVYVVGENVTSFRGSTKYCLNLICL